MPRCGRLGVAQRPELRHHSGRSRPALCGGSTARSSADKLADWLAQYPTVIAISRDRFGLYAEGAATGAPYAQQVADRFHLVLNLSGAIQRALEEESRQLLLPAPAAIDEVQATVKQEQTPAPPTRMQIRSQQQRQRRLELYEKVMQLHGEGHSQRAIGTALQIQRKTVRRWVRAGEFPERKRYKRRPSKVHPKSGSSGRIRSA